jgi:hypothetical protein
MSNSTPRLRIKTQTRNDKRDHSAEEIIMARNDAETEAIVNEESPLLGPPTSDEEQPEQKEEQQSRGNVWFWRIFWLVLAALISAVFIKGWIDAGSDIDVRAAT